MTLITTVAFEVALINLSLYDTGHGAHFQNVTTFSNNPIISTFLVYKSYNTHPTSLLTPFFGLDTLASLFIVLTAFLILVSLVVGAKSRIFGSTKFFVLCVISIEIALFVAFSTLDLFIFYLAFESLTVPTFFLIYLYGGEIQKLRAAKFFLVYSFISSTLLNFGIAILYNYTLTTSIQQIVYKLNIDSITAERYISIYIFLLLGFAIKIPLAPFYS